MIINPQFRITFARTIKYLRKNSRERGHDANIDMFIKAMEINQLEPSGSNLTRINEAKLK
jgi:hypothetical protein